MPLDPALLITGGGLKGPMFDGVARERPPPLPALPAGTRLGPYEIDALLGTGGMALVYRAHRCDGAFEQAVALKVSRVGVRAQAQRERDILGRLRHPLVAAIFDAGETADGFSWFAMELVEGWNIAEYVQQRHCGWRERVQLLREVCQALHYAHQFLILHRDIKPSNVLVSADGHLKLMDFGVAASTQDPDDSEAVPFTPGYASPEQLGGAPLSLRSDIYQLGLLIEELLPAVDHGDAAAARVEIPTLVQRNIAAIVAKATSLEPDARYASADLVEADLVRVAAFKPVRALAGSWALQLRFFARRHPVVSTVASLALLLAGVFSLQAVQLAAHNRDLREREIHDAESGRLFLSNLLRSAPTAGKALSVVDMLDRGAAQTFSLMRDQPRERVIAVEVLIEAYVAAGARAKAQALYENTTQEFETRHAELLPERARLAAALVKCYECYGAVATTADFGAAIDKAQQLIDAAGLAEGTTERLSVGKARVALLDRLNRSDEAFALADSLIAAAERAGLVDSPQFAGVLFRRGFMRWLFYSDNAGAVVDMRRAMRVLEQLYGPGHAFVVSNSAFLAQAAAAAGEYDYAHALLTRREQEARAAYGEDSVEYARALSAMGVLLMYWGGEAASSEAFARIERGHAIVKATDPRLFLGDVSAYGYAIALLQSGRAGEAVQLMSIITQVYRRQYDPAHPVILIAETRLADAQCKAGDTAGALTLFDRLLDQGMRAVRNPAAAAEYGLRRADCHLAANESAQAREVARQWLGPAAVAALQRRSREQAEQLLSRLAQPAAP